MDTEEALPTVGKITITIAKHLNRMTSVSLYRAITFLSSRRAKAAPQHSRDLADEEAIEAVQEALGRLFVGGGRDGPGRRYSATHSGARHYDCGGGEATRGAE